MSGPPPREIAVSDAVVAELLRAGAPAFAGLPRRVVAEGWDNVIIRLGDHFQLRLARRAQAAALLVREQRWLPEIAPLLPVSVPVPVLAHVGARRGKSGAGATGASEAGASGAGVGGYPWPWSIAAWLPGETAGSRPRTNARAWAPQLAAALAALHRPAPAEAPVNPVRAVPLAVRADVVSERLDRGLRAGLLTPAAASGARATWRRGLAAPPWPGPRLWVHGDPHPNNLLVSPGGLGGGDERGEDALAALLDWGDLSGGDPACDLAAAWLVFDGAGRAAFRAAYERAWPGARAAGVAGTAGGIAGVGSATGAAGATGDPGRWERAAAWAVSMASSVLVDAPDDTVNRGWARAAFDAWR